MGFFFSFFRKSYGAVAFYSLSSPTVPVLLGTYASGSSFLVGYSVAVTMVNGAVYGFMGEPKATPTATGLVRAIYFSSPTSTSPTATATAAATTPRAFVGAFATMMNGYQFGAVAGSYSSASLPASFSTVTIGASGASITMTPFTVVDTSTPSNC